MVDQIINIEPIEIVLREGEVELAEICAETIPRRLAWRDNMLAFDGETLNEATA